MADGRYVELDRDSPWVGVIEQMHGPRCSTCGRLIDHPGRCPDCERALAADGGWLTKRQAAIRAQVSLRTINRWIHDDLLQVVGGRGTVRTRPEWVDKCLEQLASRRNA